MKIATLASLGALGISITFMAPAASAMPITAGIDKGDSAVVLQVKHKRKCRTKWVNGYKKWVCWRPKHGYKSVKHWNHRHKHGSGYDKLWHKHSWTGTKAHGH